MTRYRQTQPQLGDRPFLADGGMETTLVFHEGLELPYFAAFVLLDDPAGREAMERYFRSYVAIARELGTGIVLESATWRASRDWGARLGWEPERLADANRRAIGQLARLRDELDTPRTPIVVSGCVGPRGDGYDPGMLMTAREAQDYHREQIAILAGTEADLVTAMTFTNAPEAVGFVHAAREAGMPCVVSLTVETDGALPTSQSLREAVEEIDRETARAPLYYMVNCAHPTHFDGALAGGSWAQRVRGVRANASRASHAELDAAEALDDGDPQELGAQYAELRGRLPWLAVLGGCCGTDQRHVEAIGRACLAAEGQPRAPTA